MLGRALKITYSLIISLVPLLYLGGYLSFIPGLPSPAALLGSFGLTDESGFFNIAAGGAGTAVPFGAMGLSGLVAYRLLSGVGRSVSSAAMMGTMPSPEGMMKQMNFQGFMGGMTGMQMGVPESLPLDITKSQYIVLRSYKQGCKNPKEVSRSLSIDRKEAEGMTSQLISNGYMTKDNKLTGKSLGILS
jgi:hypothetical protein